VIDDESDPITHVLDTRGQKWISFTVTDATELFITADATQLKDSDAKFYPCDIILTDPYQGRKKYSLNIYLMESDGGYVDVTSQDEDFLPSNKQKRSDNPEFITNPTVEPQSISNTGEVTVKFS